MGGDSAARSARRVRFSLERANARSHPGRRRVDSCRGRPGISQQVRRARASAAPAQRRYVLSFLGRRSTAPAARRQTARCSLDHPRLARRAARRGRNRGRVAPFRGRGLHRNLAPPLPVGTPSGGGRGSIAPVAGSQLPRYCPLALTKNARFGKCGDRLRISAHQKLPAKRETTHRAETSLPVTIFASPRNFIFVAPVEIPGSANVVTGFEFPRTRNSQPNARPLTARKLRCLSPFLPALETSYLSLR